MEKKNKNQISTLLLIVGVIFILIAGSIFVTTAWQHLSEFGKRLILTAIVAGLYVASWRLREKGILAKTEHALYYLAAAGTGFITVSFLGGWSTANGYLEEVVNSGAFNNADRAMWGLFATAIAIGYRFFKEKKVWDFGILAFVLINMFFLVFDANVNDMAGMIPLIGLTLLASYQYIETKKTGYRIFQSFGLITINHFFFFELYEMLNDIVDFRKYADLWWIFMVMAVDVLLMVIFARTELVINASVINWFMVLVQLLGGISDWGDEELHIYSIVPFALTMALGCYIMWKREEKDRYVKLALTHITLVVFEFVIFIMTQTSWYDGIGWDDLAIAAMIMCVMIAFIFEIVDSMLVNDIAKRIMKTFALIFVELGMIFLSFIVSPDDFEVEICCTFFGAGIVLLGRIWYDKEKIMSIIQFVLTCIILGILLLHNIAVEELANLMFLGITGIIMLIVAAFKNRKEYVIAASVTLTLLAIYLTRQFWLSIEWWVYLFAAGVVLVGIAVKKEREA